MTPTAPDFPRLKEFLSLPHSGDRARVMSLLQEREFRVPPELPRLDHREHVLVALRRLAEEGLGSLAYPAAFGGADAPGRAIAVFETLALGDTSVLVKFGVQFGLWGGSVHQLGTDAHHRRFLRDIAALDLPGCYAMTEVGHGSNVRDLETTATFDPETDEFVVHTPHEGAAKEWIGNAALHGRMATVFARLLAAGKDHGVHAFLVPIRDQNWNPVSGVRIKDNGPKSGLNGVDNGRIWFDNVRVPREHLLDRFAGVTPAGRYESPIESPGRRFFTMLGTLVAGRISIAAASVSAAKAGLAIAVRYSAARRQFGPDGGDEVPILDYPVHQKLLLPLVARTYALHFAVRELADRYDAAIRRQRESGGLPGEEMREVEAGAAALKALASWHCLEALQSARESMGGRGFHAANRIGRLRADTDIFTTFEGANPVLLQLVAKALLTQHREEMGDLDVVGLVRFVAERAGSRVAEMNPLITRRTDPDHLRDPEFHQAAFRYREERLLDSAARRLKDRLDEGMDPFEAFNQCQDHMVALGRAHGERMEVEAFRRAVVRAPTPGASEFLRDMAALHALSRLDTDKGWFLEAGYMEPAKTRAVRREAAALAADLRGLAGEAVGAWGIPDAVLGAPDLPGNGAAPEP